MNVNNANYVVAFDEELGDEYITIIEVASGKTKVHLTFEEAEALGEAIMLLLHTQKKSIEKMC